MARLIRNNEQVEIDSNLQKYLSYGEIVKPIPEYNNYFVTNTGRVFSGKYKIEYETLRGDRYYSIIWKELKQRTINGYLAVNITNNEGIRKTEYIHYLVYKTFNGWVDKSVLKIIHRDKDKLNNRIGNLAVVLRKKDDYQAHKSYAYRVKMQKILGWECIPNNELWERV